MEKKTVLISGGTSGIGLASARLCARAGMNVVINGRKEERGLKAVHEVEPFGNVVYVKGDVTEEADCQRMVEAAVSTFGNLTGVVTSAGYYRQELLENENSEEIRRIFEVNVFGTVLLCRAAYGALKKHGGSIVIISSDAGLQGNTACSIYGATKGAVTAFAKSLALEGATHKIRVNALCPGDVMTPLVEKQLAEDTSLSLGDMASVYPLGRIATADEVGKVVAFLLSDDASFITGTALPVDGGLTSC